MSYNNNIIQTLGVDDESTYGKKLAITVAVDTLGMCTISFGSSYSIRIPEDDVDALRDVLYSASTRLMAQRNKTEAAEEMAVEADDYNPEAEVAELSSYEDNLMPDNSGQEGEWQPYKSPNRF
jgi:mevalonate kinase